jgi:thiol:disulfide interchange protein DsbC
MRFPTLLALLCLAAGGAFAQEAAIRKNLAERLPNFPPIDEITKTAIPGIYEVRVGTDILYTDERADHLLQGVLIDTRTRSNLTEARIEKLTAIDFATLPLKDAIAIKQGNGSRKLVVFADPNCGYCKRLERDLMSLKDVTVYNFLYPILGPDSTAKAKDIWCAKDAARVWRDWMVEGAAPPKVTAKCDTAAIDRNVELGRKYRVQGTPALVFEDGTRRPGALPAAEVEKLLVAAKKG